MADTAMTREEDIGHLHGALTPKGSRISVPQNPGLGLEPDPNVIRKYLRV
jgi:L-alanine-DL-glutamate epimerase-like enolase superfamily enzyme